MSDTTELKVVCIVCGKSRPMHRSELNRGSGKYCSKRCHSRHRSQKAAAKKARTAPAVRTDPRTVPEPAIGDGGLGACGCGRAARLTSVENRRDERKRFVVGCSWSECYAYKVAEGATFDEARRKWNARYAVMDGVDDADA